MMAVQVDTGATDTAVMHPRLFRDAAYEKKHVNTHTVYNAIQKKTNKQTFVAQLLLTLATTMSAGLNLDRRRGIH